MAAITRRQALIALGAGVAVASVGWGRFAVGDTFEAHVGRQLGLETDVVAELLDVMRDELGAAEYDLRASGFLFATLAPTADLTPEGVRRESIEAFVGPLLEIDQGFATGPILLGVRSRGVGSACNGLRRT